MVSAADSLAEMTPFLLTFAVARGSAKQIFSVIDRVSMINPINSNGNRFDRSHVKGDIEFKNVFFSYPSRPDVQVQFVHSVFSASKLVEFRKYSSNQCDNLIGSRLLSDLRAFVV